MLSATAMPQFSGESKPAKFQKGPVAVGMVEAGLRAVCAICVRFEVKSHTG